MELGKKVIIDKIYKSINTNARKTWVVRNIKKTEGIFVGYRILREGYFDWDMHRVTDHIKVALIATNLRGCVYAPINYL